MKEQNIKYKGAYLSCYYFRKGRVSGQIAVLMTLLIAVIFLFITVTINIGNIGFLRTTISNAADGAMLTLTSNLGSYAKLLSKQEGGGDLCWTAVIETVVGVVLIVYGLYTWAAGGGAAVAEGVVILAGQAYTETITQDQIAEANKKLRKLPPKLQFREGAIQYALFKTVFDDPMKVTDNYSGVEDSDNDGETTDKVPFFGVWYSKRVDDLEDYQEELEDLISNFFSWRFRFAYRSIADGLDNLTVQLDQNFQRYEDEGFDLTFYDGSENDEVSALVDDVQYFIDWYDEIAVFGGGFLDGLTNASDLTYTFDNWYRDLYDESTHSDWYDRIWNGNGIYVVSYPSTEEIEEKGWYEMLESWITELETNVIPNLPEATTEPILHQGDVNALITHIRAVQANISFLHVGIATFATEIADLEDKYEGCSNSALYSWKDNRGWHHVRVKVGDFNLPYLHVDKDWFHDPEVSLKNGSGSLDIEVIRYDEDNPTYFRNDENGVALWNFRYRKNPDQTPSDSYNLDGVIAGDNGFITAWDLSNADRDIINNRIENYGIVSTASGYFSKHMSDIKLTGVK